MSQTTLQLLTAGALALFVFFLMLYVMRRGGGPAALAALPPAPLPKNPIGFALPS